MFGNKIKLLESVVLAVESSRQALEVRIGSSIQFTRIEILAGKITKDSSDPKRPEDSSRLVTISGQLGVPWLTQTWRGDDRGCTLKKFTATICVKQPGAGSLWFVPEDLPGEISLDEVDYVLHWKHLATGLNEVKIVRKYRPQLSSENLMYIGTNWHDRSAVQIG